MSIDAIRLRNFRGFEHAEIELKPLTVLLGPNSSGKSSFGHALAALAHAQGMFGRTSRLTLTPESVEDGRTWPVDLGRLADLRTNGCRDRVYVGLRTVDGWVEMGFGLEGVVPELELTSLAHPTGTDTTPVVPTRTVEPAPSDPEATTTVPLQDVRAAVIPPAGQVKIDRVNEQRWIETDSMAEVRPWFGGLLLLELQRLVGLPGQFTGVQVSGIARDAVERMLSQLAYLRAVRERPLRGYGVRPRGSGCGYGGEWVATVLREHEKDVPLVRPPPDSVLGTPEQALDAPWESSEASLTTAVGFWLSHLGLARSASADDAPGRLLAIRFSLREGDPLRDVTEVGFGLSQILPVLVAGETLPAGGTVVVDLPEAHLHPAPQAALADFFCALVLSGRRAIVETHSELFFHQLRLRAEMNSNLRRAIGVYFIDEPRQGRCCPPRPVGLDAEDELSWPVGFLQEGWRIETVIQALRDARRTRAL
jgi:AAA ATPase-like protein/putative AbiEii toxin of type IV toxin-antitoxin system